MYRYPNYEKELIRKIQRLELLLDKAYDEKVKGKVFDEIEKLRKKLKELLNPK